MFCFVFYLRRICAGGFYFMPPSTSQIPFFPSFYWYFTSRSSRFLFFWLVSYPPAFTLPASLGWYLTSQTSPFLPLLTGILPAVSPLFRLVQLVPYQPCPTFLLQSTAIQPNHHSPKLAYKSPPYALLQPH